MESLLDQGRASLQPSKLFAFLHLTLYFSSSVWVKIVQTRGWLATALPASARFPTPPFAYLLAGQHEGLGADWQSLCSPSNMRQVAFMPIKPHSGCIQVFKNDRKQEKGTQPMGLKTCTMVLLC